MFECIVSNWLNCLGKINMYGLVGGGVPLRVGYEVSNPFYGHSQDSVHTDIFHLPPPSLYISRHKFSVTTPLSCLPSTLSFSSCDLRGLIRDSHRSVGEILSTGA